MILYIYKYGVISPIFSTSKFTFKEDLRAGRSISVKINLESITEFEIKDSNEIYQYTCEYDGETYALRNKPTYSKGLDKLTYEYTLTFTNSYSDLGGLYFKDILPLGEGCNFTSDFTFNGTISQLKDRLQYNLDSQIGQGVWSVIFQQGYIPSDDIIITTFSKQKITDVLGSIVWKSAKVDYDTKGHIITLGVKRILVDYIFDYNNGLSKKDKSLSNEKPITRINGSGGTRNIPFNYYRNLFKKFVYILPANGEPQYTYILNDDKSAWKWDGSKWVRDLQGWSDTSDKLMPKVMRDTWISDRKIKKWYDAQSEYPFNDYTEDDNEDIYPTIKGAVNKAGQAIDELIVVPDTYNDDITAEGKLKESFFNVQINNLDFDLFRAISTQGDLTMWMQSGVNTGTKYVVNKINGINILGGAGSLYIKNQRLAVGKIEATANLEDVIVPNGFNVLKRGGSGGTNLAYISKTIKLGFYKTPDTVTRTDWIFFSPLIMHYLFNTESIDIKDFTFEIRYYLEDSLGSKVNIGSAKKLTYLDNGELTYKVIDYSTVLNINVSPNTSYNIIAGISTILEKRNYPISINFDIDIRFEDKEPFISDNPIRKEDRPTTSGNEPITLTISKDISTLGDNVVRPTNLFPLAVGDKFIFENIDFSEVAEVYITNAEKKLEDSLLEILNDKKDAKFNYSLDLSKEYIRNEDISNIRAGNDISNIRAGNIIKVEDENNQIDITSLSIEFGNNIEPKYIITSSETRKYSGIINEEIININKLIKKTNEDVRKQIYTNPSIIYTQAQSDSGTYNHNLLINRDENNQHTISSITDLDKLIKPIYNENGVVNELELPIGAISKDKLSTQSFKCYGNTNIDGDCIAPKLVLSTLVPSLPTKNMLYLYAGVGVFSQIPAKDGGIILQDVWDSLTTNIDNFRDKQIHYSHLSSVLSSYQLIENAIKEHSILQTQIDALVVRADVVDIVDSKASLDAYDISKITENDVIKVLKDETKNNQRTYYKLIKRIWNYIGTEGDSYTKAELDSKLSPIISDINILEKGLSDEIFNRIYYDNILGNRIKKFEDNIIIIDDNITILNNLICNGDLIAPRLTLSKVAPASPTADMLYLYAGVGVFSQTPSSGGGNSVVWGGVASEGYRQLIVDDVGELLALQGHKHREYVKEVKAGSGDLVTVSGSSASDGSGAIITINTPFSSQFAPSAHSHTISDITNLSSASVSYAVRTDVFEGRYTGSGGYQKPNYFNRGGRLQMMSGLPGCTDHYHDCLILNSYISDVPICNMIAGDKHGEGLFYLFQQDANSDTWINKGMFWHSGNFNPSAKSNIGHVHSISDLPAGIVVDRYYTHTDNNFTTGLKTKLDGIAEIKVNNAVNADTVDYYRYLGDYQFTASALPNSFNVGISNGFVGSDSGFGHLGSVLTVHSYGGGGGGTLQIYAPYSPNYGGKNMKVRFGNYDNNNGNSWTELRSVAFLDDNVASSTKLKTPRLIWGQSFDGTSGVNGNLTCNGNISATGSITASTFNCNGNAVINNAVITSLNVSGTSQFEQYANFQQGAGTSSDMRYKKNIKNLQDTLSFICSTDCFTYTWEKDNLKYDSVGFSAQQWKKGRFNFLVFGNENLSINYSNAVAIAFAGIKELKENTEREIKELKDRIIQLEQQLDYGNREW